MDQRLWIKILTIVVLLVHHSTDGRGVAGTFQYDCVYQSDKRARLYQGRQELRIPIVYRNGKELTEYASGNYKAFGKFITEMALTK
jgi:hypothetical protein